MSRDWQNGLFSCFSAGGFVGWCCPCILYGKTNHRLKHEHDVNMSEYSAFNGPCALFCVVAHFTAGIGACVMQTLQRAEVRGHAGIKGSTGGDCVIACCCHCCSLVQDVQETRDWAEKKGQYAIAGAPVQPVHQAPMSYGQADQAYPPPQQHGNHPPPMQQQQHY